MRFSTRTLFALLFAVVLPATALLAQPDESNAITAAARAYLAANSAVGSPRIEIETVKGNFARVRVVPKNAETDPAILFLAKTNGAWKGLLLGTAFEPEDYAEFHIPQSIWVP